MLLHKKYTRNTNSRNSGAMSSTGWRRMAREQLYRTAIFLKIERSNPAVRTSDLDDCMQPTALLQTLQGREYFSVSFLYNGALIHTW